MRSKIMQIVLTFKEVLIKTILSLMIIQNVTTQGNELKCSMYKKLIFEETKTFSYFLPGAAETYFTEDYCAAAGGFVVGGENASPREFSFAARLGHKAANGYVNWFCGGTLLSETFILTAAHCFHAALGDINIVRLGELDFNSDTDDAKPEDFDVKQLIEHPDYNFTLPYNDIGLVVLSSNVKFDRFKHPACLPTKQPNENIFIAIGWGHMKFSAEVSSHLQKVTLKFYSYDACKFIAEGLNGKQWFPDGLKASQICAGSTEGKDTCQGDSGGPLLIRHTNYPCMYNVIGITSLGISACGLPNVPAIYTNVSYFIDWINENVY